MNIELMAPYFGAFQKGASLDIYQSKLCVYCGILTYKVEEMDVFPILVLYGPHGTGKSTIERLMVQLVYNPVPKPNFSKLIEWNGLKLGTDTLPSLRDTLGQNTTALIEEGDAPKNKEKLIADRFSRQTAVWGYMKEKDIGYAQTKANFFGATVIHKRSGFRDPATTSRSIFIKTKLQPDKQRVHTTFTKEEIDIFRSISQTLGFKPFSPNNRTEQLWNPMLAIAQSLKDIEWISWALEQLKEQEKSHISGTTYDPQAAIIHAILNIATEEDTSKPPKQTLKEGKYELTKIQDFVDKNLGVKKSISEIQHILQLLGFDVKMKQGVPRVNITLDKVKKSCADYAIEDEVLDSI